jgi:CO/xanthine dehydrogenase FAD-binding subunit
VLGDWLTTTLEPDELITSVAIPPAGPGSRVGFAELARRHGDFALAGAAVALSLGEGGAVADARVVAFGGLPRARRSAGAEQVLQGQVPSDEILAAASRAASEDADPSSDIHASAEYRKHLVEVMTLRALRDALAKEA